MEIETWGGYGDRDLFVKRGSQASRTSCNYKDSAYKEILELLADNKVSNKNEFKRYSKIKLVPEFSEKEDKKKKYFGVGLEGKLFAYGGSNYRFRIVIGKELFNSLDKYKELSDKIKEYNDIKNNQLEHIKRLQRFLPEYKACDIKELEKTFSIDKILNL